MPIVITESSVTSTSTIIIIYEEGNKLKINRGINFCTVDKKKIIVNVADVIIDTNHPWNGARPNFITMASSITTDSEGIGEAFQLTLKMYRENAILAPRNISVN